MRALSGVVTFAVLSLALGFTVKNQGNVTLSFWPLDAEVTMPSAMWTFGLLFLGFFLGSFVVWFGSLRYRLEARRLRKELAALRCAKDVSRQDETSVVPSPSFYKRKFLRLDP